MSDQPPTRHLTGLHKLPDVKEPDDELIDAVAKLLYQQMVERSTRSHPSYSKPKDITSKQATASRMSRMTPRWCSHCHSI